MQDLTSALTSGVSAVAEIHGQLSLAVMLLILGLGALITLGWSLRRDTDS